ncbi:microsomal signal peptidase [Phanerochaete sordida]|uniref:Signal peptidase complex subunit 1 n=1 Tax=Phanerochaete sordida TaxID=48140 RepID=A0A9P3GQJ9_9APHY|nr:microsomal signal peptidase [Phanerochaete sordida]
MDALQAKIQSIFEGKIDFEGQKKVEQISRVTLVAAAVVSFIVGFALQSLRATFVIFISANIVLFLVVVPPWPMFNQHPVKFLPAKSPSNDKKSS